MPRRRGSVTLLLHTIRRTYRVHTRHAHWFEVDDCVELPVISSGDNSVVAGMAPRVRPPPLTGAIPSDSFLRRSISAFTRFPRPRGGGRTFLLLGISEKNVNQAHMPVI